MIRSVLRGSFVLALVAVVASSALGEKKKRVKKDPAAMAAERKIGQWEKKIELTEEQKTQIKEIATASQPKVTAATDAVTALLTDEQKEARKAALKQSKADGIAAKECKAFVMEKLNLTDEQKEKMTELDAEVKKVQKGINQEMMAVLTDEQKMAVKPARKGKGKKKAAAAG